MKLLHLLLAHIHTHTHRHIHTYTHRHTDTHTDTRQKGLRKRENPRRRQGHTQSEHTKTHSDTREYTDSVARLTIDHRPSTKRLQSVSHLSFSPSVFKSRQVRSLQNRPLALGSFSPLLLPPPHHLLLLLIIPIITTTHRHHLLLQHHLLILLTLPLLHQYFVLATLQHLRLRLRVETSLKLHIRVSRLALPTQQLDYDVPKIILQHSMCPFSLFLSLPVDISLVHRHTH